MIMGLGSVLNILFGMIRMKVAAVLLGPAAVGLIGIYQNLMQTTATVASLGMESSGTRQIAAAASETSPNHSSVVRRAVSIGMFILALVAGLLMWTSGEPLAKWLLGEPVSMWDLTWLSFGASITVLSSAQFAQLSGMRRVGDIARIQVISGLSSALGSVGLIWTLKHDGIAPFVVLLPAASMLAGIYYTHKQAHPNSRFPTVTELTAEWRLLFFPGIAFMMSQIVSMGGLLFIRGQIQHSAGADALGMFQASWSIGMVYLSFAINAMAADFYPRLSASANNHRDAARIINEQVEVALLVCGPLIVGMLSLSPIVIRLLYSAEFDAAASIMRWQLIGDILKVAAFPLGYLMLARRAGRSFVIAEAAGIGIFAIAVTVLTPRYGVVAAGVSFLLFQLVYLPTVYIIARVQTGFRWQADVLRLGFTLLLAAVTTTLLAQLYDRTGPILGVILTLGFGLFSLARLGSKAELSGPVGKLSKLSKKAFDLFRRR